MTSPPLDVLMISYACSPVRGGEFLLGWEWAKKLAARGHRVVVLTAAHTLHEGKAVLPPGMTLLAVREDGFASLRGAGLLGEQLYYMKWARAAWAMARRIADEQPIDIVHQCTFHTYRWAFEPAQWTDVGTVWGPLAGLERVPLRFLPTLGWRSLTEIIRAVGDEMRKRQPIIRRSLAAADHVIVSNADTEKVLAAIVDRAYEYIPANAVELPPMGPYVLPPVGRLDLVAVGFMVAMRPHNLVLDAIAAIPHARRASLTLTFIGAGPTEGALKARVGKLGLSDCVRFLGAQPRDETLRRMRAAHVLVFPSLRDSGSSSVAEAMTMGLPVIGFDLAGPGAMLAKGGGLIVRARTPGGATQQLQAHFERLLANPAELAGISRSQITAAKPLFDWPGRVDRLEALYRSAVAKKRSAHAPKRTAARL